LHVRATVDRCLRKDGRDRARDMADVRIALDGGFAPAPAAAEARSRATPVRLAVATLLVLSIDAAAGWLVRRDAAVPAQPSAAEQNRPLIAVRPFRSLSADPQQGYFRGRHDRGDPRPALAGPGVAHPERQRARRLCRRSAARGTRAGTAKLR
jgi:hypothetical protein